jgi:hypothetical protein
MIAARALMNPTAQAACLELCLGLGRPISAVRVNIRRRIGFVQKPIEFLTVMHARVGHVILPDQLVPARIIMGKDEKAFLQRLTEVYASQQLSRLRKIIGVAASHHRLLCIHPFMDGNGRVTRLRIPVKATMLSGAWRPRDPVDDDQGGARAWWRRWSYFLISVFAVRVK